MSERINYVVLETRESVAAVAAQLEGETVALTARQVSVGPPEAAVLALLEAVPLEWLDRLKRDLVGPIQRRRLKAERELKYQDN